MLEFNHNTAAFNLYGSGVKEPVRFALRRHQLRFFLFLFVLLVLTIVVLYVMGANRKPEQRIIEQEISLEAS